MKGSITITDTIGMLAMVILLVVFIAQIIPQILSVIIDNFSKTSGEHVARQLSNLITISGSAAYKAELNYIPSKDVVYKVFISSRTLKVTPKFTVAYADKSSSIQPFAVDLEDQDYVDVNSFIIRKEFVDGESEYGFSAS